MRRRASLTASMTGSASAPACRSNTRSRSLDRRARPNTGRWQAVIKGNGWGYGVHRWCHFHAYADDHDRHWLAFGHRPENRLHVDQRLACCLYTTPSGRSTRQSKRPTPFRWAFASASIRSGQSWQRRNGRTGAVSALRCGRRQVAALPRSVHVPVTFPFQYKDGWFFSGGAEYKWTDRLTVRARRRLRNFTRH